MLTISDREFYRVVSFVRENFGINLIKKRALVQGRLAMDVERRGYPSFEKYFDAVFAHPEGLECQRMIDKLSTNHTFFFREPGCFTHMRDVAVPAFVKGGARRIDVWCAAAATGQECYSIAMMLEEALLLYGGVDYRILGSDINSEALATARTGVYPHKELENIPPRFQKRYCRARDDGSFEVAPILRERIEWKQINLARSLGTLPTRSYPLIFCRNVMIYFEAETKERLTSELYRIVRDDGYVYVGNTETLDIKRTRFQYLQPAVFSKRRAPL